jgi:putative two-component system response regulator
MTLDHHELKQLPILAVDDEEANVLLLRRVLERAGYTSLAMTSDPLQVPAMYRANRPSLVLVDLHMPEMDGFELMENLGALTEERRDIPFLVLTADATDEAKRRALSLGARDFLTKPLDQIELLLRVQNVLQVQKLQDELFEHNATLEEQVAHRTRELDKARLEILERLALAAEFRDDATQEHARRIGRTSYLLAIGLGLPRAEAELIGRAAPLHDVGKIGIPDSILLKPGLLTDVEFEQIKTHTTMGAEILSGGASALLRMAETIALTHHERWDGNGYPHGVAGEKIPLPGRIVAVADVFDALAHARPYKPPFETAAAVAEIVDGRGRHFDPNIVDAFLELDHDGLVAPADGWEPVAELPPLRGVHAPAHPAESRVA